MSGSATAQRQRKPQALKNQPPPAGPFNPRGADAAPFRMGVAKKRVPYGGVDILDPFGLSRPAGRSRPILGPAREAPPEHKTPEQISHLYERALTSAAMSFHESALEILEEVTAQAPDHAGAWRMLAELLRLAGRDTQADDAQARAEALAGAPSPWQDAQGERSPTKLERLDRKLAERLEKMPQEKRISYLRDLLFADPLDVVAMRYLSGEEEMAEDDITARQLFERAIALSPSYMIARADYARLLMIQRSFSAALKQSEYLLANAPNSVSHRLLRADAAVHMERFDEAVGLFEGILKQEPANTHLWNSYGSVLKALGRREESVRAYRTLLTIQPSNGNAYFGISEHKAKYLTADDVTAMRGFLRRGIPEVTSRKCMAYALAGSLERAHDYEGSFEAYAFGARVCKEEVANTHRAYDPVKFAERLDRLRTTFTAENLSARAAPARTQPPAVTPIFVLGMPRAGSTLVEQILGSHSQVEATRELPVVSNLTKRIAMSRVLVEPDVYPKRVLDYSRAELDALGQDCLTAMAEYRKTTLPFVIDKRPWNWLDIGLIELMLPQAKFIDIRRAPMSAGFAMFKQLLPADAAFSFDLSHLGNYYRNYVEFMADMDIALPGRILRVSYEDLVDDTETQIRRMLDYCGLPFEEGCLRFWESDRAVMTPSAEQVRRPIFRDAMQQWKNYEPWLGPLKEALGYLAET
jgi:tetratricopeptide (TPR) repeat protein